MYFQQKTNVFNALKKLLIINYISSLLPNFDERQIIATDPPVQGTGTAWGARLWPPTALAGWVSGLG